MHRKRTLLLLIPLKYTSLAFSYLKGFIHQQRLAEYNILPYLFYTSFSPQRTFPFCLFFIKFKLVWNRTCVYFCVSWLLLSLSCCLHIASNTFQTDSAAGIPCNNIGPFRNLKWFFVLLAVVFDQQRKGMFASAFFPTSVVFSLKKQQIYEHSQQLAEWFWLFSTVYCIWHLNHTQL